MNDSMLIMVVRSKVRVDGMKLQNHNQTGVPVRTKVRAGATSLQHNQTAIPVRTKVRAGGIRLSNHNQAAVAVRT